MGILCVTASSAAASLGSSQIKAYAYPVSPAYIAVLCAFVHAKLVFIQAKAIGVDYIKVSVSRERKTAGADGRSAATIVSYAYYHSYDASIVRDDPLCASFGICAWATYR